MILTVFFFIFTFFFLETENSVEIKAKKGSSRGANKVGQNS